MAEEVLIKVITDTSAVEGDLQKTKDEVDKVKNAVKDTGKEADKAKTMVGGLGSKIDSMTGGAITGFRSMLGMIRAQIAAMGILKTAIIATGIGALLIAFTTLFSYLTKTEEGAQKLKVVMAQVGAVMDIVFDRLVAYYTMLYKALTFDFEGAAVAAKEAFSGLGDELSREVGLAGELTTELKRIEDAEEDLALARSEQNKQLAAKRELLLDENLSLADKKRILKEVSDAEEILNKKELKNAQDRVNALEKQIKLKKKPSEAEADAVEAAKIRVNELETESTARQIKLGKQISGFNKQSAAEQSERVKAATAEADAAAEKTRLQKEAARAAEIKFYEDLAKLQADDAKRLEDGLISQYEKDWQAAYDYYADLIVLAEKYNLSKAEIDALRAKQTEATLKVETDANQSALDKQDEANKIAADKALATENALQDAKQALVNATFGLLTELASQNADHARDIAIAQTIWNMGVGIVGALTSPEGWLTGLGAANWINAAAVAATGVAQLASINRTSLGGGNTPDANVTAPVSAGATSAASALQGSQTQQLSEIINRQNMNPTRAYVVSTEVTSQQALDRRIRSNALFG
jgi:hypothetical protein